MMKSLYRLDRLAWLALLVWVPFCPGQIPVFPVQKIDVKHIGPQAVSDDLVKANIRIKPGDPYLPSAVDEDVRNLYGTGFFSNVRVAEQRADDGIILTYILIGKPKLTDIKFVGNKKYRDAKLRKKVSAKIGEPLDEHKLFSDSQEIKKMYEKAGYPHTEVKYVVNIDENAGRGTAAFEITESPKIKITKVEFVGAQAFPQKLGFFEKLFHPSRKGLCRVIKTREHWMFSWMTGSGVFKQEQFEDDREKLAEFYRDKGYIDFEIKEVKFESPTPTTMIVRWTINEGNPYKVGAVTFKGATMFPTNKVDQMLKMKVGEVFTPKGLTKDVERVEDFYGAQGHIDVTENSGNLRVVKIPNTDRGTMDLEYRVEEGQKSLIEKIEIRGNAVTKDRVIRRELAVSPGEVFNMVRVKVSKQRLEGLQYFEKVDTRTEATDPPIANRKNLVVGVEEKSTGNMILGAGLSSVDSIVGFVEVSQANFDLFKWRAPWFRGGGQKIRLRVQMGTERQDYLLSFIEPWFLGRKLSLGVDAYHRQLNFQSVDNLYDESRTGARLSLTRALGSDFWIGGVSYTIEEVGIRFDSSAHGARIIPVQIPGTDPPLYEYVVDPGNTPQTLLDEKGSSLFSKVGFSLAYDTRNSVTMPDHGQRTELLGEVASSYLGSERDFYKLELVSAGYIRGLFKGHVLELCGRVGIVDGMLGDTVPFYERFYLGGQSSMRGFHYRGISPREPGISEPIGGYSCWFGSAEYSIPITQQGRTGVRLAAFYDIGNVLLGSHDLDFAGFRDNWGIGLRLNLPIGPLRLDYGIPIHKRSGDVIQHFQFGVGYTRQF